MVRRIDEKEKGVWRSLDWWTILIYMALLAFGWISICGASYDFDMEGNIFSFDSRSGMQIIWIGTSLALGFILLMLDGKLYDTFAYVIYALLLVLLFVTPFLARDIKGSHSWIKIGPFSLQSAEFAKCATALALAKFMSAYGYNISRWKDFLVTLAIIVVPIVLIILQRETGSALVYLAFFLMLYREGMPGAVLFTGVSAVAYFVVGVRFEHVMLGHIPTSAGEFLVLMMVILFTIGMVHVYCDKVSVERNILFDITWILITVCVAMILYLCYVALSERVTRYFYIALFALGSMAFFYSADYVLNSVMEPHQRVRINVLLGLEDDPSGAGYNVNQAKIAIGSGTGYRFHFLYGRGGRRVLGCGRSIGVVPGAHSPLDSFGRAPTLCLWAYLWLLCDECFPVPCVYQRGNGVGTYAGYRYSVAVLQLRRFIPVGLHHLVVRIPAHRCRTQSGQEGLRL